MCIICGAPNPTHEELIVKGVLLVAGSGSLIAVDRWLAPLRERFDELHQRPESKTNIQHPPGVSEPGTGSESLQ